MKIIENFIFDIGAEVVVDAEIFGQAVHDRVEVRCVEVK